MSDERAAAYALLQQVAGVEIALTSVQRGIEDDEDLVAERLLCRVDEDDVAVSSFGILFALSVLSFSDARPAGYGHEIARDDDEWTIADFLAHLSYERGQVHVTTDYVRGRRMKTRITVAEDGTIVLNTLGRAGQAAHWVGLLQGRRQAALVLPGLGRSAGPES